MDMRLEKPGYTGWTYISLHIIHYVIRTKSNWTQKLLGNKRT